MFRPKLWTCLKTYDRKTFLADLFAGVTVGFVALPLAMAFAIASNLPPERGLFTAIVAGFLISALGGSRVQIGGPTGAFVVVVAGVAAKFGYPGLVCCTLLAGILLIAFGLLRMGALIRFIPFPVTTGFTTGIAIVIFSTQIKDLFGLRMETPPVEFVGKWIAYGQHLGSINPQATAIGIGVILMTILLRRWSPRVPAMLVAMAVATIVSSVLGLDVETIGGRFGDLPRTLPTPTLPLVDWSVWRELISPALTIALLAAIESLLSATVADGMIGGRHRPNTELVAQGVANMASVVFGGIPATGAIARTATNIRSGGMTPVAGLIHAVTLALVLLLMAPLAKQIPVSALAGILVVVAYNMSEIRHVVAMFRAPRSDLLVLLLTLALTVFVDLVVAVEVGVVLASLLFIRRMSEVTHIGMITRELQGDDEEPDDPNAIATRDVPQGVEVFEIQGPFFFGAADRFKEAISLCDHTMRVIILRIRHVPAIDATGLYALREFHKSNRQKGIVVVLSGVHTQPLFAIQRSGLFDEIGRENILGNIDDALNRAREILGLSPVKRPTPFIPTVAREATEQAE